MKVYFYSKIDAILKVNGTFVGKIDKTPSYLSVENESLLEFLPLSEEYYPITVYGFTSKQAKIFKLKNSLLVCPIFQKKRNAPYSVVAQKYFNIFNSKHILTVLADGSYKFHLNGDFYISSEIPFLPTSFNVDECGDFVFVSFDQKKKCLFVYHLKDNSLELCFKDIVDDYSFSSNVLKVYKKYKTPTFIDVTETWTYNNSFKLTSTATEYDKSVLMANDKIKGLLFLNLLILNADVSAFLSSELLKKSNAIKEFLDYPYLCFENFESAKNNEYLLLTKSGVKCVVLSFLNNQIVDFGVDDY